jgi:hypothetical protein
MTIFLTDYTLEPGGRLRTSGPHSGEEWRETVLLPALQATSGVLTVDLDGVDGFTSGFIQEALGSLPPERLRVLCKDEPGILACLPKATPPQTPPQGLLARWRAWWGGGSSIPPLKQ